MIKIRVTDIPHDAPFEHEPKITITVQGTHDVSRAVNLLAHGLTEHVHVAAQLVSKLRALPGGVAALRLLAEHGGTDYTVEYPGGRDPAEGDKS
jgi:hypothetical protein